MTIENHVISLMMTSFRYTYDNNIADNNRDRSAANVVLLRNLETFLRQNMLEELEEILARYDSLQEFLITDHGHNFADKDSGNNWKCEIMTTNRYNQDERRANKMFRSLKSYVPYKESLFIMYRIPKSLSDVAEELTKQINRSIEHHLIPEHQYSAHRDVRNRVNEMIQKVFASIWASVELSGLSKRELCTNSSVVVMLIRIPIRSSEEGSEILNPENWEANPFNSEFLSIHLGNIGMENIEIADEPNRCDFYDPITKTNCRIGVDLRLIHEREEMILEYFKLDKRVKPLVFAVIHFTKSHSLTKDDYHQFLSITSYILMVLRFLMCAVKNPIIISLQNPPVTCKSTKCRFNRHNGRVLFDVHEGITESYVKYHDCIRIKNSVTEEFNGTGNFEELESSLWVSENNENLGSLLIGFFRFYSYSWNYRPISIINNDGTPFNLEKDDIMKNQAFVQDPFVPEKNISQTCRNKHFERIIESFHNAKNALKNGASFEQICDPNL